MNPLNGSPAISPLAEQAHESAPRAAVPSLLIVDDVEDNRIVLARRFRRRGFDIVEASGGKEALALIAGRSFDTVMLDVMMPEMDGIEVLRRIRTDHSASALPVIMVTARSQSEDVVSALALGANDYVTKPVDFDVALARVNSQIERRRAEQEAHSNAACCSTKP
jgi:DNA-binding response OmpR family regulator